MFAHIELITTYIAGARLLVRPVWPSRDGARQLHQPSRPRGELRPVRFLQHSEVYYSMLQHACAVGASVCDVTAVWRHLPQHRSFCCSIYLRAAVDERGAIRKPFAPCCSCVTSPVCDVMQHRIFCRKPNRPLGMPPRLGRPRRYYLPGAPDEPPSPPAPTRQTGRRPHRVTSSRPPKWTMLNAVCSNAASTFNIACTVLQVASKSCLMISVSFGCAGFWL